MKRSEAHGRVVLARAQVVIEARKIALASPGAHEQLDAALDRLYQAHRDRAAADPDGVSEEEA